MDGWFRPVFARRQTPTLSTDVASFSTDDSYLRGEAVSKSRATSRVGSRMGFFLGSPSVPAAPTFRTAPAAPAIQTPDILYHKPSPDQMVETIKVVMMNQNSLDPVPIQYNSCILHALEAYYDLQVQLQRKTEELESLKKRHDRDIDDFDEMTKGWSMRENDYQQEVKRLEVLLANTEGGMEAVSIARSHSLVHGSRKVSDNISRGIGTIKDRNEQGSRQDSDDLPFAAKRSQISDGIQFHPSTKESGQSGPVAATSVHPSDKASITTLSSSSSSTKTQPREELAKSHSSDNWSLVPAWAKASLGNRHAEQRRRGKQEPGGSHGAPTVLGTVPSNVLMRKETAASDTLRGRRGFRDKPLPSIPGRVAERPRQFIPKVPSLSENDEYSGSQPYIPALPEMGFSFRPGDDASILSPNLVEDEFESQTSHKTRRGTSSTSSTFAERPDSGNKTQNPENRGKKPCDTKPKASIAVKSSHIPREFRESYEALTREDSTSSVVTAVRDNSGKSTHSAQNSKQTGRPTLERGIGNTIGDAVSAAAEALAKAGRNSPGESVRTSGSREESEMEREAQGSKERSASCSTSGASRKKASH